VEYSTEHWQRKIDHRLKALWGRVAQHHRTTYQIRVLIQVAGPSESLQDLGLEIHAVAGDIVSGAMMLVDLPRLAEAAPIRFVELAQPIAPDL
jgi:hypothetical protein